MNKGNPGLDKPLSVQKNYDNLLIYGCNFEYAKVEQHFVVEGQYIVNRKTRKVVEVKDGKDVEAQTSKVGVKIAAGDAKQKWRIVYLDTLKDGFKGFNTDKGVNKYFGFRVDTPFFIQSRMP